MQIKNRSIQWMFTCILTLITILILSTEYDFRLTHATIITHVILGVLALIVGTITFTSKKGGRLHRMSGRGFYLLMTISVFLSLIVAITPFHRSPTLFQIGILSLYLLIGGRRSLLFKRPNYNFIYDILLAGTVVIVSMVVMLYSLITVGELYPLRVVFGIIGIAFGSLDLWLLQSEQHRKTLWLALHLSKMLGGYIAAVTAFFVAQNFLGGYYDWFVPSVFGLTIILFWLVKIRVFTLSSLISDRKAQLN